MTDVRGARVAVVGGSVAGLAAAIEADRAGCDVTVYERSAATLQGRGAGISCPPEHLQDLRRHDLVDADLPLVDRSGAYREFTVASPAPEGRVIASQPISTYGLNWADLYGSLRRRVPDRAFRQGARVTGVRDQGASFPRLVLDNGHQVEVDAVLFADGHASVGRTLVDRDAEVTDAGYIVWRGTVAPGDVSAIRPATEMAMHSGGHCVIYAVPSGGHPDRHMWNVVWYLRVNEAERADLLRDRFGAQHTTSVPRGNVRTDVVGAMHARAGRLLRPRAAEVVTAIPDPFVQVVRDACTSRRLFGRLALIGDAAAVARPHTGAGALKATSEAMALGDALGRCDDLDTAFRTWAEETHPRCQETYRLGRALGSALVLETPEWDDFDDEMLLDYWNKATAGGRPHYVDARRAKQQPVAPRHSK